MNAITLAGIRLRIEESLESLPDPGDMPNEQYDRIDEICIAVLDSEWADFEEGLLEKYLLTYLQLRQMEPGLHGCM